MTIILSSANVLAHKEGLKHKNLSISESKELLEHVQYLLSDRETIDYEDPKFNLILSKYDYDLFKIYRSFIEFDKSDKTLADINNAAKFLDLSCDNLDIETIFTQFFRKMSHNLIGRDLEDLLPENLYDSWYEGYRYIKIPLWLVKKYPHIVNYTNGPNCLSVNSKFSIKNLKEFNEFISKFANIHNGYITPMHGHQKINSYLITKDFINVVSFNPRRYVEHNLKYGECAKKSFKERMLYSEKNSYLTIEKRLLYEEFLEYLPKFSRALKDYFDSNDFLDYSDQVDNIISHYICEHTEQDDDYDPLVVNLIALSDASNINDLKPLIQTLNKDRKSEFLRHAVTANLDFDFIKWLIKNGADTNYKFKFRGETPLMASFRNIKVMKLLLKCGADINAQNKKSETALFYAIKFNNLEAVKILIDKGANVNAFTDPSVPVLDNTDFVSTPLIWAERYASKEIINLLIKHQAKEGSADPKKIKEWIDKGPS